MKKILSLFIILSVFSCTDELLKEVPKDRLSVENFFQNKTDAVSAIYAVYKPLMSESMYGARYLAHLEVLADYINGRGSYTPVSNYQGLDNTNIGRTDNIWFLFYQVIARANSVIANVPGVDMNETLKSEIIAEAYCLRAFSYFHLVRGFGAVPLRIDEANSLDDLSAPRSSVDDVYAQIISDLEIAERDLPDTPQQAGRPTKSVAKTILADVYLTRENFSKAKEKADEVISTGLFSLVPVIKVDDFNNLYGPQVITSSEEIFSLHFLPIQGLGLIFLTYTHHPDAGYSTGGNRAVLGIPSSPIFTNWSNNDLRKEWSIYTEYINVKTGKLVVLRGTNEPMLFRKFRDPSAPTYDHGNNFPLYRYAEVLLIYAEAASQDENGPSALALERANMVRRRGYGQNITTPSSFDIPSGLSKQDFRDTLLIERAHEFIIEGKRWFDLLRTGTAKSAVESVAGKSFSNKALLNPIPLNEINTNPALDDSDQNPGY